MHRSMLGGPFLFQNPAALKLPEENGRGSLFLSCRTRRARHAWPYRPFPPSCHPPWTFGWTTLRCEERRIKAAQTHTPRRGKRDGYMSFGLSRSTDDLCLRAASGKPADGMSRGRAFTLRDLAKGGICEGQRRCLVVGRPRSPPLRG
ncbi:putative mucin-associated surface protein (MASP) [Trypanosoma cruzi]|nr:putative mucin-associated surface protein (MASP) [Trypanosoma cruzi]